MINNPKLLKIVILALFLLLVIGGITGWIYHSQTQKQLQDDGQRQLLQSEQRILAADQKLAASEQTRKMLEHTRDSLATRLNDLTRIHAANLAELRTIKGRFSNLDSKQLAYKMTEEFNKNQ